MTNKGKKRSGSVRPAPPNESTKARIRRRAGNRARRKKQVFRNRLLAGVLALVLVLMILVARRFQDLADPTRVRNLSEAVLSYQDMLEDYAKQNDISHYVPYLLAIMQVESGGEGQDVMQSSESLGMPAGTLDNEASIKQACVYFSELLVRAKKLDCDMNCVLQAYNYGISYLDYAAREGGGVHSFDLAVAFAKEKSGGATTVYLNPIAIAENGGWRYSFGNMFYVDLVRQYLE